MIDLPHHLERRIWPLYDECHNFNELGQWIIDNRKIVEPLSGEQWGTRRGSRLENIDFLEANLLSQRGPLIITGKLKLFYGGRTPKWRYEWLNVLGINILDSAISYTRNGEAVIHVSFSMQMEDFPTLFLGFILDKINQHADVVRVLSSMPGAQQCAQYYKYSDFLVLIHHLRNQLPLSYKTTKFTAFCSDIMENDGDITQARIQLIKRVFGESHECYVTVRSGVIGDDISSTVQIGIREFVSASLDDVMLSLMRGDIVDAKIIPITDL